MSRALAVEVRFVGDALFVRLADGRQFRAPLEFFPRLHTATPEQRNDWRLIGNGLGIRWDSIDEDLSVEDFVANGSPVRDKIKEKRFKKALEKVIRKHGRALKRLAERG